MPRASLALLVLAALSASAAAADGRWDSYPIELTERPLTLPRGMAAATVDADANLSSGSVLQPIEPGLKLGYGLSNELMLGGQIDLCTNGNGGCASAVNDATVGATFLFDRRGGDGMGLALGLQIAGFSPRVELSLPVGFVFRYHLPGEDFFAIRFDPQLLIALTDRSDNRYDRFHAPFAFQFQVTRQFELQPQLSFSIPIEAPNLVNNELTGTLGLGARYSFTNLLDVGGSLSLSKVLAEDATSSTGIEARIFVAARF